MVRLGLWVAVLAVSGVATAAPTPPAPGGAIAIFGVDLGAPLTLPQCADPNPLKVDATCWTYEFPPIEGIPPTATQFEFRALHFPNGSALGSDITAMVPASGEVKFITLATAGVSDQDYVLAQLTAKFGKPTQLQHVSVQNRMGAAYVVIRAVWDLPSCFVQFDADGSDGGAAEGSIDKGWVSITTRKTHDEDAARQRKALGSRQPL